MATETKATAIIEQTRAELQEQLFERFFESVIEQAAMTPEQTAALDEYIEHGSDVPAVLVKRDQLAMFVHRWEAETEYLRSQEILLAERRRNIETFLGHFKGGMLAQFLCWGIKKIEGRLHRFSVKKNPGRVEVYNEELLPTEYLTYKPQPDKAAIKAALESGKEIPGARFGEVSYHIEIK